MTAPGTAPGQAAHRQHTCQECQAMIKNGGHRIIDLLGHAGYETYRAGIGRGFALKWADTREAWAQTARVIGGMWAPCDSFEDWLAARGYDDVYSFDQDGMAEAFEAGANVAAQAAIAAAAPAPAAEGGSLRADLEDIVKTWRENAVYRPTDTRDEMNENYGVSQCADTLAGILADHPEQPQAAPELAAAMAALREIARISYGYDPGTIEHDLHQIAKRALKDQP